MNVWAVWDSLRFLDIPFPMRNKLAIQVAAVAQRAAPWPLPKIVVIVAFHVASEQCLVTYLSGGFQVGFMRI